MRIFYDVLRRWPSRLSLSVYVNSVRGQLALYLDPTPLTRPLAPQEFGYTSLSLRLVL